MRYLTRKSYRLPELIPTMRIKTPLITLSALTLMAASVQAQFVITFGVVGEENFDTADTMVWNITSGNIAGEASNAASSASVTSTGSTVFTGTQASVLSMTGYRLSSGTAQAALNDFTGNQWNTTNLTDVGWRIQGGAGNKLAAGQDNNTWNFMGVGGVATNTEFGLATFTAPVGYDLVTYFDGTSDNKAFFISNGTVVGSDEISQGDDSAITIAAGQTMDVMYVNAAESGASKRLESITIDFVAVPEPSAYAMLAGLLALTSVMIRRRK